MRTARVIVTLAAAFVALAGTAPDAEARGGRGLGRLFSTPRTPPRVGVGAGVVVGVPVGARARNEQQPLMASAAPAAMIATAAAVPSEPAVGEAPSPRAKGPWCPTQRTIGSGAGFCQIN